ncbi:MAG TPA: DUF488 family protein [Chloroflexota bacterium]|nr:DUF488 family protein [Chloroflexota bacterium]
MSVRLRRIYEPPEPDDGVRILVDRLWPRGLKKEDAHIDAWLRDVAPSSDLRRWFGHDAGRWSDFRARYRAELQEPERAADLQRLVDEARKGPVTILCAAHDLEQSNGAVIRDLIAERLGQPAA